MVEVRLIKTDYRQLPLHYAVIVGKYEGKWVLCQHKKAHDLGGAGRTHRRRGNARGGCAQGAL